VRQEPIKLLERRDNAAKTNPFSMGILENHMATGDRDAASTNKGFFDGN
jgi:hypothetical protein